MGLMHGPGVMMTGMPRGVDCMTGAGNNPDLRAGRLEIVCSLLWSLLEHSRLVQLTLASLPPLYRQVIYSCQAVYSKHLSFLILSLHKPQFIHIRIAAVAIE